MATRNARTSNVTSNAAPQSSAQAPQSSAQAPQSAQAPAPVPFSVATYVASGAGHKLVAARLDKLQAADVAHKAAKTAHKAAQAAQVASRHRDDRTEVKTGDDPALIAAAAELADCTAKREALAAKAIADCGLSEATLIAVAAAALYALQGALSDLTTSHLARAVKVCGLAKLAGVKCAGLAPLAAAAAAKLDRVEKRMDQIGADGADLIAAMATIADDTAC